MDEPVRSIAYPLTDESIIRSEYERSARSIRELDLTHWEVEMARKGWGVEASRLCSTALWLDAGRVRAVAPLTPGHKKRPRERGLGLRRWPASADEIVKGRGPLSQANPTICAQF